jgi:hypothetical protein
MLCDSLWYVCSLLLPLSVRGDTVVVKNVDVTEYIFGAFVKICCLVKIIIQLVIKSVDKNDDF